MVYAISDIHGCYEKFVEMLRSIHFSNEEDLLFVLGDVVDRGPDGIKVLEMMMENDHMVPIMGNHERVAYEILRQLEEIIVRGEEKIRRKHIRVINRICGYWFQEGGFSTLTEYSRLNKVRRKAVLKYLGDFLPHMEITVNDRNFVLVHAGIQGFEEQKSLFDYPTEAFLYERADYNRVYFQDKYLVTGHTPTDLIEGHYSGIYMKNNHIAIDCGAAFGKQLACICLDTLEQFYV